MWRMLVIHLFISHVQILMYVYVCFAIRKENGKYIQHNNVSQLLTHFHCFIIHSLNVAKK